VEFQIQNEHMRIGYLHAQISDAQISDATVTIDESANQTIDIAALRFGIGKTGVQLRFYKKKEFDKLPADQRNELKAWRQTPEGKAATARDRAQKEKANGGKPSPKKGGKISAAAFEKELKRRVQQYTDEESKKKGLHDTLVSALKTVNSSGKAPAPAASADVNAIVLAKILGKKGD